MTLLAALASLPATSRGAIIVWADTGTVFSTGTNWVGSAAPANDSTTDIASFGTVATNQPALDSNYSLNGITFTAAGTVTLSGAFTLTLGSGGINNTSASLTKTVSSNLALAAAQSFTNGTVVGAVLTISGNVANGGNLLTLSGTDTAGTLSGIVSGTGGLTKDDTGTWLLSGANTFSGATTLNAGTLRATTAAGALGSGTLTLAGGTLELANDSALIFGRNTTISANTAITSDRLIGGVGVTHTLGTLAIGTNTLTIAAGANATSATAGITFGATTLSGDPTFAVNSGTATAQLTLGALNDGGAARTLTKTGTGTLIFAAAPGAALTSGDTLVVNGGIAQVNVANALTSTNSFAVQINSTSAATAAFNLNGVSQTVASLTFGGVGANAGATNNVATGAGTLTLGGGVTFDATNNPLGSTLSGLLALGATRTFTIGDSSNAASDLAVTAIISGATFGINKQGAGKLTLSGVNTFTGPVTVSAGTLRATTSTGALGAGAATLTLAGGALELANDAALNFARNTTVSANTSITLDRLTTGAAVTMTLGTLSLGSNTLTVGQGVAANFNANIVAGLTFGATTLTGNPTFTLNNTNGTGIGVTTLGALSDGGIARTITKDGPAQLTFGAAAVGGALTAGDQLVVNRGTALVNVTNALGTTGVFDVTVNGTTAGTTTAFNVAPLVTQTIRSLTFGGAGATSTSTNNVGTGTGTLTLAGNVTYDATNNPLGSNLSGNLALGTADRTFTIGNSSSTTSDLAVSALVSSTGGGLIKEGAGTLVLSGANTFTNAVTINAGTIRATTSAQALGTGAATLTLSGGNLELAAAAALSFSRNTTVTAGTTITPDRLAANAGSLTHTLGTLAIGAQSLTVTRGSFITGAGIGGVAFGATTLSANGPNFLTNANTLLSLDALSGDYDFTKSGAGQLTLTADSTRNGATTTLSAGTLRLSSANALGTTQTGFVLNGGTLSLFSDTASAFNGTNLTLGGAATITPERATLGNNVTHTLGTLSIGTQTLTVAAGTNFNPNNTGSLTLGNVSLTGDPTFALTNSSGTGIGLTTLGALGDGGFARTITKNGAGTLIFGAAPNSLTSGTNLVINRGLAQVNTADALGATALTNVTVNSTTAGATATFALNNVNQSILSLTFGGSSGTVTSTSTVTTGTGILTLGGGITYDATGLPLGSTLSGLLDLGGATRTFLINDSTNAANDLTISAAISGSGFGLTKTGLGTLVLSGANTFTGATTIKGGTVALGASNSLADSSTVVVNSTTLGTTALFNLANFSDTIGGLTFGGAGATATSTNNVSTGTGTLALAGNVTYDATNNPLGSTLSGLLEFGSSDRTFTIGDSSNTANDLTVSAVISSSSGGLIKEGAGTLVLSGANTFTNAITINAGTLKLGAAGAAPNGPLGTAGGATTVNSGGSLDLGGFTLATAETLTLSGSGILSAGALVNSGAAATFSGAVTLGTGGATIGGSGAITLSAALAADAVTLTKAGANKLTLSVDSTRTGAAQINAGTIALNTANALGTSAVPVTLNGGGLTLANNAGTAFGAYNTTVTASSTITPDRIAAGTSVTHTLGTLTIGTSTLTVAASVNFSASNIGSLTFGNVTLTGNPTFALNNTNTIFGVTTLGAIDDGGVVRAISKSGTATLTLGTAATSLVDGTAFNLSAGITNLNVTAALGTLANVTVTGGTLALGAAAPQTLGALNGSVGTVTLGANTLTIGNTNNLDSAFTGVISGTGGITKAGTGTLTLSATNTFTGATILNTGTLRATSVVGALGAGTLTLNGGTLVLANNSALNFARATTIGAAANITSDVVTNGNAPVTHTLGTLSIAAQTLTVTKGSNAAAGTAGVSFGATTITAPGGATFSPGANTLLTLASVTGATFGFNVAGAGNLTVTGIVGTTSGGVTMGGTGTLTFGGVNTQTGTTTLSSGTLTVNLGAALSAAAAPLVVNGGALNLNNVAQTVASLNGSGGTITLASGTTLTDNTAGADSFSGTITGTNGALTKSGVGTLTLSGANTYTGTTTIAGGTIVAAALANAGVNSPLGAGATIAIGSGATAGTLKYTGTGNTTDRVVNLAGAAGGATLDSSGTGALIFTSAFTATGAGIKSLTFSGTNTAANEIQGAIVDNSGTNKTSLIKAGVGAWKISGTNTYTGTTTVSAGTLSLGSSAALPNTAVTVATNTAGGTAVLDLNGFNATVASLSLGGTAGADTASAANINTGAGVLTLGGAVTFTNTNNPLGSTISGNLSLGAATRTFTVNDSVTAAADLTVSAVVSGGANSGLTKLGTGTLVLSGASTFDGPTLIQAGTLTVNSLGNVNGGTSALGTPSTVANGTVGIGAVAVPGTLVYNGSGSITDRVINLAGTTGGATLDASGTGALVFTSAFTANGAGVKTLTLTGTSLDANEIQGAIVNSTSATSLTKSGIGSWLLSGVNTYTGTTTVSAGILTVKSGAALSAATAPLVINGGELKLNNAAQTVVSLNGSGGTLTLGGILTVSSAGADSFNGLIAGTGSLTKTGAGSLTLSTTNTYSGTTTVTTGVLRASANAAAFGTSALSLGGGTLQLADDTGLSFGHNTTVTVTSTVTPDRFSSGAFNVTQTLGTLSLGAQALNVTRGANVTGAGVAGLTFGATTLSATGAIFAPAANTFLTLASVSGTNTNFTVNGAGDAAIPGVIATGTGTLTKNGAGTLTLSGACTYTGLTTVSAGTIKSGTDDVLPDGSAITLSAIAASTATLDLNGHNDTVASLTFGGAAVTSADVITTGAGTLTLAAAGGITYLNAANPLGATISGNLALASGAHTFTIGDSTNATDDLAISAIVSSTGSISKAGAGALTLSGVNTFNGGLTLSAGTLNVANNSALGSGTLTLGGGTLTASGAARTLANPVSFTVATALGGTNALTFTGDFSQTGSLTLTASNTALTTFSGTNFILADNNQPRTLTLNGAGNVAISSIVQDGSGSGADGLTYSGTGSLTLSGTNTYTGLTTVSAGTLRATTAGALGTNVTATALTLSGGTVQLANDADTTFGRPTTVSVTSTVTPDRVSSSATSTTHTLGSLSIGAQTLNVTRGGNITSTGVAGLTFGATTLSATGAIFAPAAGTLLTLGSIAGNTFSFTVNGAGDASITGAVATTTGTLTKSGTSTLTLAGNSSFTGATTINAGVIKLGGTGSGANSPLGTTGAGTTVAATDAALDLNGFNLVTAEPLSLAGTGVSTTGALTNSSGAPTTFIGPVTLTAAASIGGTGDISLTNAAGLAGNFLLTKSGADTLTLSTASVRTGGTQIDAGTIKLANATGLSAVSQTVTLNGGNLALATDGSVSAYPTSVTAASTITSDKATTASAGITHTLGTLALGGTTLSINSGGNVSANSAFGVTFGATTLSGDATVSVANNGSGTGTLTLAAVGETGARSLTKAGAGLLVFTGANNFTGGVTLANGTLTVNSGAALAAATAPLIVNGGTLNLNNASQTVASLAGSGGTINFGGGHVLTLNQVANTSYAGALGGTGGLTKSGSGTATISGGASYSGPTTINGGTLALGSNSSLSTASALTLGGGTLALAGYTAAATTLTLGASSTIDFGASAGTNLLTFSDSHVVSWTGTLTILNYSVADADKLRFGATAAALTGSQLSAITFSGYAGGAAIDSLGYVSPIPEPATVGAVLGSIALLVTWHRRRKR